MIHLAVFEVNADLYRLYKKSTGFRWDEPDSLPVKDRFKGKMLEETLFEGLDKEEVATLKMPSMEIEGAIKEEVFRPLKK